MIRFFLLPLLLSLPLAAQEVSEADKRTVQTIQRLSGFDYAKASAKTKEAMDRYLAATAGSDEYFQLIEKYGISSQQETLIRLAAAPEGGPRAGQAVKLLFQSGQAAAVRAKLAAVDPAGAVALVEAAASVGSRETTAFAAGLLSAPGTPAAWGEAAVRGLGRNVAGQQAILAAAVAGTLPEGLKTAAAAVLATSTDEAVRTAAAKVLPMTAAVLPPVAELVKKTGDAVKGQTVFMSYCFTCHQVNGQGIDFGPALSEIGSKLPKEAIYEAILNPGAGISFGFEGWEVKMKDGNQFTGIIVSDTAKELAIKVPGGIIQKCDPGSITGREKLKVSLMTPNLHTVMSAGDLINLVEYLGSLKKK